MWYISVNFNELNGVSPFSTSEGLFMGEINFEASGLDPEGRNKIFVFNDENFYLTEEEADIIFHKVDCFDSYEDLNLLTSKEAREILEHNPYYRDEIHGY